MKRCLAILLVALGAIAPGAAPNASAEVSVGVDLGGFGVQINSASDFYTPLTPYGTWVNVGSYGRCWRPTQVAPGWRPYSDGSWVWTDAGWFWQSQEPWGWATCHYGSWTYEPTMGWLWIPGTQWAPAWVSWRYSDNYIGWAPIGPNLAAPPPSFYAFVGVNLFHSGFRPNNLIVNNVNIINQTRVVRNFQRQTVNVDGRQRTIFANKGPGVAPIERATGRRVTARPVGEVARQAGDRGNRPGNENQAGPNRPGQRPGGETPRTPTGREQQRTYPEQPGQAQPQRPDRPGQQPGAVPPTGEQLNNQQPGQRPGQRPQPPATPQEQTPQTPSRPPTVTPETPTAPSETPLPPTGRERPSGPSQATPTTPQEQTPTAPSQPPRVTPETPSAPSRPPTERPLPPTGREQALPPSQPPRERPMPPAEQGQSSERPLPPTGREHPTPPQAQPRERPQREQQQKAPPPPQPDKKQDGSAI